VPTISTGVGKRRVFAPIDFFIISPGVNGAARLVKQLSDPVGFHRVVIGQVKDEEIGVDKTLFPKKLY
jgi:hypothetical protein